MLPGLPILMSKSLETRSALGCFSYYLNYYKWAICLKENPEQVIGDISIVKIDEADLSCDKSAMCCGKAYWGHGMMTEALKAVLTFVLLKQVFKRSYHVIAVSTQLQVVSWKRLECPIYKPLLIV